MERDEIIFWFNIPPKVEKGAFNYLSKHWGKPVYYVINNDLAEYRKKNGWDDNDFGDAIVINLWKSTNKELEIEKICREHKSAINILNGFTNEIQLLVRKKLFKNQAKIGAYSERPNCAGNWLELSIRKIFFQFRYRRLNYIYRNYIDFILPLGLLGVESFTKYGWDRRKMFRFMYNPNIPITCEPFIKEDCNDVKFLYVGRFAYKTKGVKILMKACKMLKGSWSIDFVGGYGPQKKQVISWINSCPHASFIGNWSSDQVVDNINKYDVVVVPSNYEGWNLLTNEAIHASTGVIISSEAVSDEIITDSKSGVVFKAKSHKDLAKYMQQVIDGPSIINDWKRNAHAYVHKISDEAVGLYLMDILDYVYYEKKEPICPWSNSDQDEKNWLCSY